MSAQYSVEISHHTANNNTSSSTTSSNATHTDYHLKVTYLNPNSNSNSNSSETSQTSWSLLRRYREFRELHEHLKLKYPDRIPQFPGKRLFGNQDPVFLKHRMLSLQMYLNGVLSLEPDCKTQVLSEFLEIEKHNSKIQESSVTNTQVNANNQSQPVPAESVAKEETTTTSTTVNTTVPDPAPSPVTNMINQGNIIQNEITNQSQNLNNNSGENNTNSNTSMSIPTGIQNLSNIINTRPLSPQQILERAQSRYLDLNQSPANLEPQEIAIRIKRYKQAIDTYILNQPVDPIFAIGIDQFKEGYSAELKDNSFSKWAKGLKPNAKIATPSTLVVPFLQSF